mgnify:CR=1 FL=1
MRNPLSAIPASLRGIVLMLISTLFFTGMQVLARHVAEELHPFEVAFFRNFFGLVVLAPIAARAGLSALRTKRLHVHAARSVLQTAGMLTFFTALTLAPLAQIVTLSFTAPLFAAVGAVWFLHERAGAKRMLALLAGFAGALIVIRPGFAEVNIGSLLVIGSSFVWAGSMLLIKVLGRTDSTVTTTLYMGLFMVPLSLGPALFFWQWPAPEAWAWLALIGAFGAGGHLALAQALKEEDTTRIVPVDFTRLLWAALLGFIVFGEIPDVWTWVGGAVIFAAITLVALQDRGRDADRPSTNVVGA